MQIERLSSLDDHRLDVFSRLTEHQLRNRLDPARGVFIAEAISLRWVRSNVRHDSA